MTIGIIPSYLLSSPCEVDTIIKENSWMISSRTHLEMPIFNPGLVADSYSVLYMLDFGNKAAVQSSSTLVSLYTPCYARALQSRTRTISQFWLASLDGFVAM